MGLFDSIFEKKECSICGNEIGLLGNRRLADGNLCRDCASKLSPLLSDRRECTVEEIRRHLAYREQNRRVLENFHPDLVLGGATKVCIDRAAGKFLVTRSDNWRRENTDVFDLDQVTDCKVSVKEHRTELFRKLPDGKRVSYNPPRYDFSYEFDVEIPVDSPWFSGFGFELTGTRPDNPHSPAFLEESRKAEQLQQALCPRLYGEVKGPKESSGVKRPLTDEERRAGGGIRPLVKPGTDDNVKTPPQSSEPVREPSVPKEPTAGGVKVPVQSNETGRPDIAAAAAVVWYCPSCGQRNEGNFCVNCGAKKPVVRKYRCDKCGWVPDDPTKPPKFCPHCGDPFDIADID